MTIAAISRNHSKRNRRNGDVLPKPRTDEDINRIHDLAEQLNGRPVPGVRMTEEEFEAWGDEDVRAEWINREVILLSPSNLRHIRLNTWLATILETLTYARQLGSIYIEPQIRLAQVKQRRNPDVVFVSSKRSRILHRTYIDGPPDLIMEIVSPDSIVRDWRDKYLAYEKSGVREYWVIDLESQRLEAYALDRDKKFQPIIEIEGRVRSKVIQQFYLRPSWLWKMPLPDPAGVLKELGIRG